MILREADFGLQVLLLNGDDLTALLATAQPLSETEPPTFEQFPGRVRVELTDDAKALVRARSAMEAVASVAQGLEGEAQQAALDLVDRIVKLRLA